MSDEELTTILDLPNELYFLIASYFSDVPSLYSFALAHPSFYHALFDDEVVAKRELLGPLYIKIHGEAPPEGSDIKARLMNRHIQASRERQRQRQLEILRLRSDLEGKRHELRQLRASYDEETRREEQLRAQTTDLDRGLRLMNQGDMAQLWFPTAVQKGFERHIQQSASQIPTKEAVNYLERELKDCRRMKEAAKRSIQRATREVREAEALYKAAVASPDARRSQNSVGTGAGARTAASSLFSTLPRERPR